MFPLNWCNTTSLHSEFNVAWFNKSKAAWVLLFTFNLLYHIILVFTIKLCKHRSINHDSRCLQFQSERRDFFRFFFKLRNLKPTDAFRFFSFFAIHGLFCSSTNRRTFYVNVRHLGKTTWQKANENCWAFISNFLLNKAQKWTTIISNDQNKQQDAVLYLVVILLYVPELFNERNRTFSHQKITTLQSLLEVIHQRQQSDSK